MKIESYKDLEVWQKAIDLVTEVYKVSRAFPAEEIYALSNQVRRAAVSVPANIAEGWGRQATKEYIHFLRVARGSLLELETHPIISNNLNYVGCPTLEKMLEATQEINKMLNSMVNRLSKSI